MGMLKVRNTAGTPGANMLLASGVRKQSTIMREVLKALALPVQFLWVNDIVSSGVQVR